MSEVPSGWIIQAAEDKSGITVQAPNGQTFKLSEQEAAVIISDMGKAKATISNENPPTMEGTEVAVIDHPTWYTWYDSEHKRSIFSFYHPAFGPIGYALPMQVAFKVQTILQCQCFVHLDSNQKPEGH